MSTQNLKDQFENYLKEKSESYFSEKGSLCEAVRYSLLAPGKRVRPLLALGFALGFRGKQEMALASGAAVEMVHAYSLIHDDLPAMDNDDYRRGRLTNHKVYGEATAILAGDSLLNFAPQFLLKELTAQKISAEKIVTLVELLLEASGHSGMVKGQAMDMQFENEDLSRYDKETLHQILKNIHKLKTGAIITWSCIAGLYSHPDEEVVKKNFDSVKSIGEDIGLLFQMVDDVLDVTATLKELGKTPGKDEKAGKLTYTNLFGLNDAASMARTLAQNVQQKIQNLQTTGDWSVIQEIVANLEGKLPA